MARNVEIKARVHDFEAFYARAQKLCDGQEPTILEQFDTFFKSTNGRLKLRQFQGTTSTPAELIYYDRPDSEGPKLSEFVKVRVDDAQNLEKALELAMGTRGTVTKKRFLFLYGQTRIHLDRVEGLGDFMELEVTLKADETPEYGQEVADGLMKDLGIEEKDLIKGAYIDKLIEA
uniref:CYTH domain-containing protein n=1 Tax=Panagrellus redivivus TaxID=6233 RepID=A0A7E4VEP7_PANRE